MKLLSLAILTLCLLGAVVAQQQQPTTPTPTTPTPHPDMSRGEMETDPIYEEYMKKARELYVKALIDYYHAHPDRLESDLARLTSIEYEHMVPSELLSAFNIDKSKVEAKIKENDERIMNEMNDAETEIEEDDHDMDAMAVEDEDEPNEMETQQFFGRRFGYGGFGGFGRFGRGFGFGGGFGGRRFVYPFGRRWGGYGRPPWRRGFPWWGRGYDW